MVWGSVVKSAAGGVKKMAANRAQKIGKSKAGKLLAREGRVMMGKPQPKGQDGGAPPTVQPQVSLAPTAPDTGGGSKSFKSEKEAALQIKTTTIEVATLLKGSYVLEKEQLKNKRKSTEKGKRSGAEGALEKAKGMVSGFKMPKMPGKGILDTVFGFVSQLIFGTVMIKLMDFLPTIQKILPTLGKIADGAIWLGGIILETMVNLIHWGYKLVDGMGNMVKGLFGEEGAEKFKTFMTNVKDLITGFLVWKLIGQKIFKAVVANIKFAFNIAKSIVTNAFKLVNFLTGGLAGKAVNAVGKGLSRVGGAIGKRLGLGGAKKLGSSLMKKGVGGLMKRGALKLFGKTFVKAAGKIFGKVPIIGPLIVGIVSLISGEPLGQALFKTFGAAIGGLLGTFIPIPIIGTLLGETIGVFVGDLLYHLIIKKDPKAAMKMLSDAIMGIFKAGQFMFNFMKDGVTNVVDNFPTVAIPDFRPGDIIAKIMMKIPGGLDILGLEVPGWVPGIGGASVIGALQGLPGLQEVMGFFAQFIPGMGKYIKSGRLLAIPNLAMLTPLGLPFLTPLIAQSFLPGIFGAPTPPPAIGEAPSPPEKISAESIREESRRRKAEALKKQLEAVKGALGGAWNSVSGLFGGGDKDKDKDNLSKDALVEINQMDAGTAREILKLKKKKMEVGRAALQEKDPAKKEALKLEQNALSMKIRKLKGESTDASGNVLDYNKGGSTYETKLTTANQQGGAKAVIESISTTASYEDGSPEVITLPAPTSSTSKVTVPESNESVPLVVGGGGNDDPYEGLYKGG